MQTQHHIDGAFSSYGVAQGTSDLTEGLSHCVSSVWLQAPDELRFFKSISEAEVRGPAAKNGFLRWGDVKIQIGGVSRGVVCDVCRRNTISIPRRHSVVATLHSSTSDH